MKTNECVNTMSIGSFVGLLAIDDENWFRVFEESRQGVYAYIQIVLNILCQFFAHTLHITFNKHVNYMSIGLIIVIDDENWFRVFEESSQAFMHI